MIRFHLDECVSSRLTTALRHRGIDVTAANDAGLLSAVDKDHLNFAHREGRVLITHDSDFLILHQAGAAHSGLVYCPPGARTVGHIVRFLCLLPDCMTSDEMHGRVEYF